MRKPSEVEADKKEHEVNCSTQGAKLRRLNGVRPYQWDRDLRCIEVELHPAADEEGASEELPVFTGLHRDIDGRQSKKDDCGRKIGEHADLWTGVNIDLPLYACYCNFESENVRFHVGSRLRCSLLKRYFQKATSFLEFSLESLSVLIV